MRSAAGPSGRRWRSLPLVSPPWRAGRGRCPLCGSARPPFHPGRAGRAGVCAGAAFRAVGSGRGRLERASPHLLRGGRALRGAPGARAGGGSAGTCRGRARPGLWLPAPELEELRCRDSIGPRAGTTQQSKAESSGPVSLSGVAPSLASPQGPAAQNKPWLDPSPPSGVRSKVRGTRTGTIGPRNRGRRCVAGN